MTAIDPVSHVNEDLLATVRALFPGAEIDVGRGMATGPSFRFVPSMRRARLLVPADVPRAAARAVDRPSANDTFRQSVLRRGVGALLRVPPLSTMTMPNVLRVGPSQGSVVDYLAGVVGRDIRLSLAIGSRRANRKPVLNVHTVDGAEVGYAKVGLTPLADALIEHEAATLAELMQEPSRTFRAPRLLHHGRWRTSSVLLMESLRPSGHTRASRAPLEAIAELTARDGVQWQRMRDTAWFKRIMTTGEEQRSAGLAELEHLAERYLRVFGDLEIPLGRWHGDLGPWNMAWQGRTALIWDWERSEADVPVAIDAVHFVCHPALRDIGNMSRARQSLSSQGADALGAALRRIPGGDLVDVEPDLVRALVVGYLLSIAARFSADAQRPGGDSVEQLAAWHRAVLRDQLDQEEVRRTWN